MIGVRPESESRRGEKFEKYVFFAVRRTATVALYVRYMVG
jgi:hypothetical protein